MARPAAPLNSTPNSVSGLTKGKLLTFPGDLVNITDKNGKPYAIRIEAYDYSMLSQFFSNYYVSNFISYGTIIGGAIGVVGGIPGILTGAAAGALLTGGISTLTGGISILGSLLGGNQSIQQLLYTGHSVNLQLPVKINDVQTLTWSQESGKAIVDFANLIRLGESGVNYLGTGVAVNPALFMLFHHPNFKTYDMSWQFVANNEKEAETIVEIINFFKYHSSPSLPGSVPAFMTYPSVFFMKLFPDDKFTFKMKPAIVEAVAVDYSGGGFPAFYKNGAPIQVNLAVRFKEIKIWEKSSWNQSSILNTTNVQPPTS